MDISLTLVSAVNWVSAAGLDLYLQNQARCCVLGGQQGLGLDFVNLMLQYSEILKGFLNDYFSR